MFGKIKALLYWAIGQILFFYIIGLNGLFVAISALFSVQAIMFCGVVFTRDVGLDSGITIGRGQCLCILRMIFFVNSSVCFETLIRIFGFILRIIFSSDSISLSVFQLLRFSRFCISLVWKGSRFGILLVSKLKRSIIKIFCRVVFSFNFSRWVWEMIISVMSYFVEFALRKTIFFSFN